MLAAAQTRREENGDRELAQFVIRLGEKGRKDIIVDAWKMAKSKHNVALAKTSRLEILQAALTDRSNCVCGG